MPRQPILLLLFCSLAIGCKPTSPPVVENVLAQVGEKTFTLTDLQEKLNTNPIAGDSAEVVAEIINQWVREMALVEKANTALTDVERNKSALVSQYYNDLLIYELEQKLLNERLDTAVDAEDIQTYYDNNKKNFELKENIIRLRFFTIPRDVANHDKLWNKFKDGGEDNLKLLSRLCDLSSSNYFYNDSLWLSFNDILKEVPIITYNQESYLNNHRFVRLEEKQFSYFVEILDFKVKDNISPFEFEKERIKNIIIHKRKVELLQQIENEIVEEAYRNNKIEKF